MSLSSNGERDSVRNLHYLYRMQECELGDGCVVGSRSSSSHVFASTHSSTCHKIQSMWHTFSELCYSFTASFLKYLWVWHAISRVQWIRGQRREQWVVGWNVQWQSSSQQVVQFVCCVRLLWRGTERRKFSANWVTKTTKIFAQLNGFCDGNAHAAVDCPRRFADRRVRGQLRERGVFTNVLSSAERALSETRWRGGCRSIRRNATRLSIVHVLAWRTF